MSDPDLTINGVYVGKIRNRNEKRVAGLLGEVLDEYEDWTPETIDIEDIYGLALNLLPPRYTQQGTLVISGKIKDEVIKGRIREACERVKSNPTRFTE